MWEESTFANQTQAFYDCVLVPFPATVLKILQQKQQVTKRKGKSGWQGLEVTGHTAFTVRNQVMKTSCLSSSLLCLSSPGSHQGTVPPVVGGPSHLSSISTCTPAFPEPSSHVIPDFVKLTTNPNHSGSNIFVFDLNRQYRCCQNPTWLLLCKSSWQSHPQTNAAAEVSRATNHWRRSRTGRMHSPTTEPTTELQGPSVHSHDDSVGEIKRFRVGLRVWRSQPHLWSVEIHTTPII